MMERIAEASLRLNGRITGVVYLLYFLTAASSELLVRRGLVVYGNAANLIATAVYVVLTVLFYGMFMPVNRRLSLVAALFSLAGCAMTGLNVFHLASSVSPLLFFGPYCLLLGYLIFRSTFLPRTLGVLMGFAGLGWLLFLLPLLAKYLSVYIMVLGVVAEALLMLWLLVGVNVQRWKEQAGLRIGF
jgi:Domain of unknown function (DUF4386)